jgi:hypothetical protein
MVSAEVNRMQWRWKRLMAPVKRSAIPSRQRGGRSWARVAMLGVGLGVVVAIGGYLTRRPARELAGELVDRAGARRAHGNGAVELEATTAGGTPSPAKPEPESSSSPELVKSSR